MLKGGVQNYLSKLINVKILKTNYTMNTGMSTLLISGLVSHTTKQSLYCHNNICEQHIPAAVEEPIPVSKS